MGGRGVFCMAARVRSDWIGTRAGSARQIVLRTWEEAGVEVKAASGQADRLYAEREKRFYDIVALKKPDRVPVIPLMVHYFPTRIKGVSNRDAGYDNVLRYEALKEADLRFGWDFAVPNRLLPSEGLEALDMRQVRWPGGDLPDDAPFQFVESEWLAADEYDEFLADPDKFTLAKLLPRLAGAFAGLSQIEIPPLHWLSNAYNLLYAGAGLVAAPPLRTVLEALLHLADAAEANQAALNAHIGEMAALGYPYLFHAVTASAFDQISAFFRGLMGSSLDTYRRPGKLLDAIELMHPSSVGAADVAARMSGNPRVLIPVHRGADGLMSDEDFEKFYWPTFVRLLDELIAAGLTPLLLFEGNYTSRLKYLAQLPPGKIAAHFDQIDRKRFKEICGDVMCFWGNVPASLLCTGTPQQVKDNVRELIELFGDSGTLIVDANQGIPDEALPENVLALREAADEYGVL
jgi:hypothetical protein